MHLRAFKKLIVIPPSRRIELDLPDDFPVGRAEVIVLVPQPTEAQQRSPLDFTGISDEAWNEAEGADSGTTAPRDTAAPGKKG